jgi:hypothetical protein
LNPFHCYDEVIMPESTFDIFKGTTDKDAIWMEAVEGLALARERMKQLAKATPGQYFLFAQRTHSILARVDTGEKSLSVTKKTLSGAA